MDYGLQLAKAGAITAVYRQYALTNNMTNLDTPGFKPDVVLTQAREPVREEDGVWAMPSNRLLERLGGGTLMAPNGVDFGQGPLRQTGNDLDVAVQGDGFFTVREGSGPGSVRLTRDGRMALDDSGRLVMESTGLPVLGRGEQEIYINPGARVSIDVDGRIVERVGQSETVVGFLAVVDVPDRENLVKRGAGLFEPTGRGATERVRAPGAVKQRFLEDSAVNEVGAMLAVQSASGAAQRSFAMVEYHDRLIDQAINRFGRSA